MIPGKDVSSFYTLILNIKIQAQRDATGTQRISLIEDK